MLNKSIAEVIEEFLYNREYIYNKSPKTTKVYRIALHEFNKYMFKDDGKIADMMDITAIDIMIKWLKIVQSEGNKGKGLKDASLNQRIVAVSKFYQYLIGLKMPLVEVTRGLEKFKSNKNNIKKFIPIDDAENVLDECKKVNSKITSYELARNDMMINLFLGCGLRIEELSKLKYYHVNIHEEKIFITADISKKRKERTVDIPPSVLELYKAYLKERKNNKNISDFLFISRKNNPISTNAVRDVVKSISKKAIGEEIKPHALRHTYATHLIESGEDLTYVSEQMGHANISITSEIYKHQVKNAVNRAVNNPMFKNR